MSIKEQLQEYKEDLEKQLVTNEEEKVAIVNQFVNRAEYACSIDCDEVVDFRKEVYQLREARCQLKIKLRDLSDELSKL